MKTTKKRRTELQLSFMKHQVSLDEKDEQNLRNISKCHIITGCLTILLQVSTMIFSPQMFVICEGIVTGALFISTGVIGYMYLKKKKKIYLTFFLVLSIVDILGCAVLLGFSCTRVIQAIYLRQYDTDYILYLRNLPFGGAFSKSLAGLEIVMSLLQAITSITGSTIVCKVYCCIGSSPRRAHYKDRTIQVLSGCQIGLGVLFVLCYFLNYYVLSTYERIYDEIWCGLSIILIGSIGLLSVNRFYKLVTPFLILNIFGCGLVIVLITMTGIRMSDMRYQERNQYYNYQSDLSYLKSEYYNCTGEVIHFKFNVDEGDIAPIDDEIKKCEKNRQEKIRGLEQALKTIEENGTKMEDYYNILVVELIFVIVEFVVLVTTCGLVCHVCCCCCAASQQLDTTAVYVPSRKLETGESVVHVSRGERRPNAQIPEEDESRNYSRLQ